MIPRRTEKLTVSLVWLNRPPPTMVCSGAYRRTSGNDGAYRVLEKLAQRRSVNLGDSSQLGLGNGGHAMAPPLMVHRTGSAPPAPGSSPLQVSCCRCLQQVLGPSAVASLEISPCQARPWQKP